MRRLTLALVVLLVVVTPAFGDDVTKKHQVDTKISTLQDRLAAQRQHEQSLRNEVSDFTSRIRALEGKVGDVSLHLKTLEADLSLHEKRLNALNSLFSIQSKRYAFLEAQYASSISTLNRRLVDIYESDPASSLDVFLGARNVQDALDEVQYMNDIGAQDRRIAREVAYAKAQAKAARAKTKKLRTTVQGETAVVSARHGAGARRARSACRGDERSCVEQEQKARRPVGVDRRRGCRGRRDRRASGCERCDRRPDSRRPGSARRGRRHVDTVGGGADLAGQRSRSRAPSGGAGAACTRASTSAPPPAPRSTRRRPAP